MDASKYSDAEYRRLVNRQIASLDLNQVNTDFMALVNARRAQDGLAPYQNDPRSQKLAQKLAELDTVGQFWSEKEWKQWATDLGFKTFGTYPRELAAILVSMSNIIGAIRNLFPSLSIGLSFNNL
ncbi:hypothetical protein [Schleiferilactobacillus harbinensis]|uniref:hypothetical protein n=1 Tax=Schleiferilactobacillus harbinensis TaxID=304207 RepID=UPI00345E64DF